MPPIPVCGRRLHSNATRPSGAHATPAAATGQAIPNDLAEAEASRFKRLVDRPASRPARSTDPAGLVASLGAIRPIEAPTAPGE